MTASRRTTPQVMVIGIDGASWHVLNLMIEAGAMPHLTRLIETGVSGPLTSTLPPTSPPAWSSFMTGKKPGKHGIFSWWEALNLRFVPLSSRDIDGRTLWQLLGEGGKRIGVFNVPMTYPLPSYAINGFMIAGMLTPSIESQFTYPASLREELISLVGNYTIHTPWLDYEHRKDGRHALMRDLAAKLEQRSKVALALLERYETDFFMVVFAGNDRLSHCLWKYIGLDAEMPLDAEGLKIQEMIRAYYGQLDATLGDTLQYCGPQTTVLVMSDHGFGPLRKEIYINKWLADEGLLASSYNPRSWRIRTNLHRLARRLGITRERWRRVLGTRATELAQELANTIRIDWSQTRAYSNGSNSIQINLKGREPHGIVNPGSEYEAVRSQVIERLVQLRDPETGTKVVSTVFRREEVFEGPHVQRAPDILIWMADQGCAAYKCDVDVDKVVEPAGWRNGEHTLEGVLVAAGKHIKKGARIDQAGIIDLAPTILYRMDLPIPDDMDGVILTDLFEEGFLGSNTPKGATTSKVTDLGIADREQAKDREVILERLRGLGYID